MTCRGRAHGRGTAGPWSGLWSGLPAPCPVLPTGLVHPVRRTSRARLSPTRELHRPLPGPLSAPGARALHRGQDRGLPPSGPSCPCRCRSPLAGKPPADADTSFSATARDGGPVEHGRRRHPECGVPPAWPPTCQRQVLSASRAAPAAHPARPRAGWRAPGLGERAVSAPPPAARTRRRRRPGQAASGTAARATPATAGPGQRTASHGSRHVPRSSPRPSGRRPSRTHIARRWSASAVTSSVTEARPSARRAAGSAALRSAR